MTERTAEAPPRPVVRYQLDSGVSGLTPAERVARGKAAPADARAHARSGDRIAIAAYLGGSDVFDRAVTTFAAAYADQNERDYQSLVEAVASGRVTAERDA
jgi:hypothetical protein